MSTRKVSVEEITCDECGQVFFHPKDEELPLGFYVPKGIYWIHGSGGTSTNDNIYFCTKECFEFALTHIADLMQ